MESAQLLKDYFKDAMAWDRLMYTAMFLIPSLGTVVWAVWRNLERISFGRSLSRRVQRWLAAIVDRDLLVRIYEHESTGMRRVDVYYEEVKAYLGASCLRSARGLRAEGVRDGNAVADSLVFSMLDGQEVDRQFGGATVCWSASWIPTPSRSGGGEEKKERCFELRFHQRHRELVLENYLRHVQQEGRNILIDSRQRKIYTNVSDRGSGWSHVTFKHPMNFDKLAMDPEKREEIKKDLIAFQNGKKYYERVGKAWKRGYLLHGPPGTGKSAMIAAMANELDYDVYTVELTSIKSNSELQMLLMKVKSKAIIVIEDIDCSGSPDLTGAREKKQQPAAEDGNGGASAAASNSKAAETDGSSKLTLSGLLNVVDGLLSACSEERIFVFTTNHVDKLDKALIRKGRMDKRIEMSYCGFEAFKILAKMYLDVDDHERFDAVGELLREVDMTPVDVIEELTPKSKDADADSCLAALVKALEEKKANAGSSA
ncbi:unnamed protein product [Urochloa decumbens]|uniref:AAA+ ATPase domain-containing protein n=1 Tax=Urochloa decumbens TaxID=240449 RepID=A0ABC8Y574_9POAL